MSHTIIATTIDDAPFCGMGITHRYRLQHLRLTPIQILRLLLLPSAFCL